MFAFRLALAMGIFDVDGMLQEMSSELFDEWMAYYSLEPFGEMQGFVQAGIISSIVVNSNPFRSKGSNPATPQDFIPDFGRGFREKKVSSAEQVAEKMGRLVNSNVSHKERRKKRVQAIKKKKKLLETIKKQKSKGGEK